MMFRGVRATAAWLVLVGLPATGTAEEPAARRAAAKPAAPAVKAPDRKAPDAKPEGQPRAEPVDIDVEAFAAPIHRALNRGLNVNRPAAAANDGLVQQTLGQMRPLLAAELAFIRQMCDLTPEQRKQVRAAGEAALLDAARAAAAQRHPGFVRLASAAPKDPQAHVRAALSRALEQTLGEEPLQRFRAESDRRAAFRKRAAIGYVVSRLDGILYLTSSQREEITAALAKNWQDAWESWPLTRVYGERYFPVVPDQYVVRSLKPDQVAVWRGLQRVQISSWSNFNGEAIEDDGWWGDEPLGGKAAAGGAIFFGAGF